MAPKIAIGPHFNRYRTPIEQAVSAALTAPVAAARAHVAQQPVAHVDETGWREGRQRAWLWGAATTWVTVFLVHTSRGAVAARRFHSTLRNFFGPGGSGGTASRFTEGEVAPWNRATSAPESPSFFQAIRQKSFRAWTTTRVPHHVVGRRC